MNDKITGMMPVPGAELYYEARGAGPMLLLIHGGNGDADGYASAAERLADRYTVVSYDRRGHSRSSLSDPNEEYSVETHADDAARLLDALSAGPTYAFGSSSGAVIGLDLALRYPDRIRRLVAHEPPLTHLLTGEALAGARQIQEEQEAVFRREGALPALKHFATALGIDTVARPDVRRDERPHGPAATERMKRLFANTTYFLRHEAPAIRRRLLDVEALNTVLASYPLRIVISGGGESRATFPYACAAALADSLGAEFAEFPGNHLGYAHHGKAFAARLLVALEQK